MIKKINTISHSCQQKKLGLKKLLQIWNGNDFIPGEKKDQYIQKIIPELSKPVINKIYKISTQWILPILIHQKKYLNKIKKFKL
ncbi:hypothetical protein HIC20_01050 [Buchnera aphidicola (Hormaphis cornu)]|nr:hypothetical protein HIC20_01050 [Buchnera aphidicola (Hormaphis cornu)]